MARRYSRRSGSTPLDLTGVKRGTPVVIEWIDAHHVATHWSSSWPTDTCRVTSCGLLLDVTDEQIFYAADLYVEDGDPVANGIGAIPLGCVVRVRVWERD